MKAAAEKAAAEKAEAAKAAAKEKTAAEKAAKEKAEAERIAHTYYPGYEAWQADPGDSDSSFETEVYQTLEAAGVKDPLAFYRALASPLPVPEAAGAENQAVWWDCRFCGATVVGPAPLPECLCSECPSCEARFHCPGCCTRAVERFEAARSL